jgi:chemotaxis protein methyltransferase CheR
MLRRTHLTQLQHKQNMIAIADFHHAKQLLLKHAGIELNMSKQQMVFNRLLKPMRQLNYANIAEFLSDVEERQDLQQRFVNALTTNVTSFFREAHHFPILSSHVQNKLDTLQVWSAGCSTGQEPYSILIELLDVFPHLAKSPEPFILATDIDTAALAHAEQGIYSESDLNSVSPAQVEKYFDVLPDRKFQFKSNFRRLIQFKAFNLTAGSPSPWKDLDVIFCRNVMIYFGAETQRTLVSKFAKTLKPDGLLISGHTEMLLHSDKVFSSIGRTVYALRRGSS